MKFYLSFATEWNEFCLPVVCFFCVCGACVCSFSFTFGVHSFKLNALEFQMVLRNFTKILLVDEPSHSTCTIHKLFTLFPYMKIDAFFSPCFKFLTKKKTVQKHYDDNKLFLNRFIPFTKQTFIISGSALPLIK